MKTSFRVLAFPLCISLFLTTVFLLSFISRAAGQYRGSLDPWAWGVHRSLRSFAIQDIFLALVFLLPTAWLLEKIPFRWVKIFAGVVAAIIVGWFGLNY